MCKIPSGIDKNYSLVEDQGHIGFFLTKLDIKNFDEAQTVVTIIFQTVKIFDIAFSSHPRLSNSYSGQYVSMTAVGRKFGL